MRIFFEKKAFWSIFYFIEKSSVKQCSLILDTKEVKSLVIETWSKREGVEFALLEFCSYASETQSTETNNWDEVPKIGTPINLCSTTR